MQDKLLVLSEAQAVTTSAASTNYLDEGVTVNPSDPLIAEMRVMTSFNSGTGGATLQMKIQAATDAVFTSPVDIALSPAVVYTSLTAGTSVQVVIPFISDPTLIYTRAYYVASATMTAGAVTTVIQPTVYTNTSNKV
jgi:hypothetical protein